MAWPGVTGVWITRRALLRRAWLAGAAEPDVEIESNLRRSPSPSPLPSPPIRRKNRRCRAPHPRSVAARPFGSEIRAESEKKSPDQVSHQVRPAFRFPKRRQRKCWLASMQHPESVCQTLFARDRLGLAGPMRERGPAKKARPFPCVRDHPLASRALPLCELEPPFFLLRTVRIRT